MPKAVWSRLFMVVSFPWFSSPSSADVDFRRQEDLAYFQFVLPEHPDGLRSPWNGVYANFLDFHANDASVSGMNKDHEVSTESTSLLAQYAVLRGDRSVLDQVYDLWTSEARFYSPRFQLEHWLLDPAGNKISDGGAYRNAPGEEVRMMDVLFNADRKFGSGGGRNYRLLAEQLAEGLKGAGGGQGNFEPLPYAYTTSAGAGGAETIFLTPRTARVIRLDGWRRNSAFGYSLFEVEVYGPDQPGVNLALGRAASASSVEGPGFEADKVVDGDAATRWSSGFSDPQFLEVDLGADRRVDKVVLKWEAASARAYSLGFPGDVPNPTSPHLLRSWFTWDADGPLDHLWDPLRSALNVGNLVAYHRAATWLGDPFFRDVVDATLGVVENAQNADPLSPGYGNFRPQYDLGSQRYFPEGDNNGCAVLAGADMAARTGAYGHLAGVEAAVGVGRRYLDFLKARYLADGVLWASYDFDTGRPVDLFASVDIYDFFAKLAMEYGDFSLAEKVIREQILPCQVAGPSDPGYGEGYLGAFKPRGSLAEAAQDIWKDAGAFANLETLVTLGTWDAADKGAWRSEYPEWVTAASVTGGDGGEDIVDFGPVRTRYVRILCKRRAEASFGYSLWTLGVFGPGGGADLALGKAVSASTVQDDQRLGRFAADGDDGGTRWGSAFGQDPQWIYLDLGADMDVGRVRLLWEKAFAADYEVQVWPERMISLRPKNVDGSAAAAVDFGAVDGGQNLTAPGHVDLSFNSDQGAWGVDVWTDYGGANPGESSDMGGLHENFVQDAPRVPLGWQLYDEPAERDDAPPTETAPPAGLSDPRWVLIKSRKDGDWSGAQGGRARLLTGNGPGQAIVASGPRTGAKVASPVSVYLAAYFKGKPAGDYAATLGFELFHE